jgi:endonuclease/exonuclease/phosphatase family metal-dependent hydrolase
MAERQDTRANRWRLRKVLLLINIPVTSALIMAYAAQHISPDRFWPLIFFGIGFPFILLLHLTVTATWFLRSYKVGLINLAIVLMGWNPLWRTFSFHCGKTDGNDSTSFKVMTYNVRLFDYYNWSRNIHTRHWMYDFLKNQQPDILCMQEFFHDNTGYFPTLDTLREVNSIKHMHLENYQRLKIDQMWGMATLSRFPIVGKGRIEFPNTFGNMAIYTDLLIMGDTVRVYNIHLQSVRFDWDDYKVIDKLVDEGELKDYPEGKRLLLRVHDATVKRTEQAELVALHIARCPHPVIVCGDLNDTPVSYTYRTVSQGLDDTFRESGCGLGSTYTKLPFLRIDHIFHSPSFSSTGHMVHPWQLSDHFAVTAEVRKK